MAVLTGMTKKYYEKITATPQEMLWTEVPSLWSKKVQNALIENGYILNDDGTVTKAE